MFSVNQFYDKIYLYFRKWLFIRMMSSSYDCIVIGAGPAGYVAAIRLAQLGKNVAIIERSTEFGGTCLTAGCIPSKVLLDASYKYWQVNNRFSDLGITVKDANIQIEKLMRHKQDVINALSKGVEYLFKKNNIQILHGHASFNKDGSLTVTHDNNKTSTYTAAHIIIATGSKPKTVSTLAVNSEDIVTSTQALSFNEPPKHLVVIGGGYIGLELGSVWKRLGSLVTIIENGDAVVAQMDDDISTALHNALTQQGILFKLGYAVSGITHSEKKKNNEGAHICLHLSQNKDTANESPELLSCDAVLVAAGRVANTATLNLSDVGIKTDIHGKIEVNAHYETTVPGIYAIGDCIDGPMLAHKAMDEGVALAEKIMGQAGNVNYEIIPAVIFTHPEVATVGLSEKMLYKKNISYKVGKFSFYANGRAKTIGEDTGFVKILSDSETNRVLGCAIVGADAGSLIAQVAAIMEFGGTTEDIARTCHAHPTLNEVIREAAWASFSKPIHS